LVTDDVGNLMTVTWMSELPVDPCAAEMLEALAAA